MKKISDLLGDSYSSPVTVDGETPVNEVTILMKEKSIGSVVVSENGVSNGIFTERDLLFRVVAEKENLEAPVKNFMTRDFISLGPEDSIQDALNIMMGKNFRHLPIVDEDGKVRAVISLKDLATALNIE